MDIDKKIEELRKEFNEKIDKLKEEYKGEKSSKWIPKSGEIYYFVNIDLSVSYSTNLLDSIDELRFEFIKIFKTKEQAQEYADYLKARKEYSYEFSKEEWENENMSKYGIYYDYDVEDIDVEIWGTCRNIGQIFFKTEAQAQAFIDKYKKQILKFEFDIEEE